MPQEGKLHKLEKILTQFVLKRRSFQSHPTQCPGNSYLSSQWERCLSSCQSEYPGAVTGRGRAIGALRFCEAATWSCGNAESVPGQLCLTAGEGTVAQRLSSGNRENYSKSTCSALPYPISVKCRIIATQRAGTCLTSINRVVLQIIPRGSRELSPFYK